MMLLNYISKLTGLRTAYLERVVTKAPYSYKKYTIPKRNGGVREIFHPRAELKTIQRWLVTHIVSKFPVHECVYSYTKGRGIKDHAEMHKLNNYMLRIDLKNFFPSIKATDIKDLCLRNIEAFPLGTTPLDIDILCRIVCRYHNNDLGLALTIGSPASPAISNAILFEFDTKFYELSKENQLTYTRYADDLYFSTNAPNRLEHIYALVINHLETVKKPKFEINPEKTVFTSKKRKRVVTGITLTSDNQLSIGRDGKRKIRTEIFLYLNNRLDADKLPNLRGKLAYYQSVEPKLISSLKRKFGEENINKLIKN